MRDCVNMHYLSGALVKRKGAEILSTLNSTEDLTNIQGIFLYTYKLPYIIIAANGKLYYDIYDENVNINLERLPIVQEVSTSDLEFDPTNILVGLTPKVSETNDYKHEGYTIPYEDETNPEKTFKELIFQNYRKIECATLNNKLIIATGTRLVEVYPDASALKARPIIPYTINNSELINIGYNYLSPYPELNIASQNNAVATQVLSSKTEKLKDGTYKLTPILTLAAGDSLSTYKFRWEKYVNDYWVCVQTFKSQFPQYYYDENNNIVSSLDLSQNIPYQIIVSDADKYQYRVTMAKHFEIPTTLIVDNWSIDNDYQVGDIVYYNNSYYKCVESHRANEYKYNEDSFNLTAKVKQYNELTEQIDITDISKVLWKEIFEEEQVLIPTTTENVFDIYSDYKVNLTLEIENHTATSVLFNNDIGINDMFLTINSCTKILADGYKLLLYDDNYNSGMWYKTIISNPYYITDRGNLSFKTKKNEKLIKVIPFQGNLIVFANTENIGGSIHIVTGNGDDFNSNDGYYSPYQRRTINSTISSDNANTIQVCDNILIFKYFNRIYYINASDLNNDVVKVTPCNDRVLSKNSNVNIPWEDNNCVSVITKDYYALLWKEKYYIDDNGDLILEHPALRVKMYYKLANQINNSTYTMPWLRDESKYFNVEDFLYIKGNPLYLYHNLLLNFEGTSYEDIEEEVQTKILLRGYDLQYPKLSKLVHSVILYYHRNQSSQVNLKITVRNEAGHILLTSDDNKKSTQDLRTLFANNEMHLATNLKLDSTIQDTKVINAQYAFPALLADAEIIATNKGEFSLSSITFTYTTCESPDTTQFDLYNTIIRPQDIKGGLQ